MQTEDINEVVMVAADNPLTLIGELTPIPLPSGIAYEALLLNVCGTEPVALVEPFNVMQFPEQILPGVPASTIGNVLTVTGCEMAF